MTKEFEEMQMEMRRNTAPYRSYTEAKKVLKSIGKFEKTDTKKIIHNPYGSGYYVVNKFKDISGKPVTIVFGVDKSGRRGRYSRGGSFTGKYLALNRKKLNEVISERPVKRRKTREFGLHLLS